MRQFLVPTLLTSRAGSKFELSYISWWLASLFGKQGIQLMKTLNEIKIKKESRIWIYESTEQQICNINMHKKRGKTKICKNLQQYRYTKVWKHQKHKSTTYIHLMQPLHSCIAAVLWWVSCRFMKFRCFASWRNVLLQLTHCWNLNEAPKGQLHIQHQRICQHIMFMLGWYIDICVNIIPAWTQASENT